MPPPCRSLAFLGALCLSVPLLFSQGQAPAVNDGVATFGSTVVIATGLRGAVYRLQEGNLRLPNFDKLKPVGYIYTNQLNVSRRQFTAGFPGLGNIVEWFGIDYHGRFYVTKPGKYRFMMASDDGAQLLIDDILVIDQDGTHDASSPDTVPYTLTAGLHTIHVRYYQGPKYELALVLNVAPPGEKMKLFNMNDFLPPEGTENWSTADAAALKKIDDQDRLRNQTQEASTPEERDALKTLAQKPLPHDFDFKTAAFGFKNVDGKSQSAYAFDLPVANLKDTVDPKTGAHTINVYVFGVVKDVAGRIVQRFSLGKAAPIPADQWANFRNTSLAFTRQVDLPQGQYTFETVVVDRVANATSTAVVDVDRNTVIADGLNLSSPILIQRVLPANGTPDPKDPFIYQGSRLIPQLGKDLKAGANQQVYFAVYPTKAVSGNPAVKVEFLVGGQLKAQQASPLPPPDANGVIPITIAAPLQPGDCELRITALQGDQTMTKSVAYSVKP